MDQNELIDISQVMDELKIARQTVYNWTCSRKINHYKIGKKLFFKRADIKQYIERCKVESV